MPDAPRSRPDVTASLARGVARMLRERGLAPLLEVPLANGRRADVLALAADGAFWIVEIKSCLEDWRADHKWEEYAPFCDAFFVAVDCDFPLERLPNDVGLIVADAFGGELVRPAAAASPLVPARRKAMTLAFARLAALRAALT